MWKNIAYILFLGDANFINLRLKTEVENKNSLRKKIQQFLAILQKIAQFRGSFFSFCSYTFEVFRIPLIKAKSFGRRKLNEFDGIFLDFFCLISDKFGHFSIHFIVTKYLHLL